MSVVRAKEERTRPSRSTRQLFDLLDHYREQVLRAFEN